MFIINLSMNSKQIFKETSLLLPIRFQSNSDEILVNIICITSMKHIIFAAECV